MSSLVETYCCTGVCYKGGMGGGGGMKYVYVF